MGLTHHFIQAYSTLKRIKCHDGISLAVFRDGGNAGGRLSSDILQGMPETGMGGLGTVWHPPSKSSDTGEVPGGSL